MLPYANSAVPVLATWYALLLGALSIFQALGLRLNESVLYLERNLHVVARANTTIPSFFFGAVMLFIAYQLWLRKRAALYALAGFLLLASLAEAFGGRNELVITISVTSAVLLLLAREGFPARPDPASISKLKKLAPLLFSIFLAYGIIGLFLLSAKVGADRNFFALGYRALMLGLGEPGPLHISGWPLLFAISLTLLAVSTVLYVLTLLFSPVREDECRNAEDHLLARRLVERYGSDSLAYFNVRPDKSLFFLSDKIFLAYRRVGGIAVISGDPVGPEELVAEILSGFRLHCLERGLRLTTIGSRADYVPYYEEAGLKCVCIGEEPVIHVQGFSLEGRRVRKLRQSVNRLEKAGTTMEFMFNEAIPAHLRHELAQLSSDWRGGRPETGFSMGLGRLMNNEDHDCLLSIAYDTEGVPIGFLYLVPMYPHLGYSLDITRTMVGAPNGLSEFMLARAALFLGERGYRYMSLHFLAFSHHYREDRPDPGSATVRSLARLLERLVPVTTLYRFDRKFSPKYNKRYLVYESVLDFPRIFVASLSAESALKLATQRDANRR